MYVIWKCNLEIMQVFYIYKSLHQKFKTQKYVFWNTAISESVVVGFYINRFCLLCKTILIMVLTFNHFYLQLFFLQKMLWLKNYLLIWFRCINIFKKKSLLGITKYSKNGERDFCLIWKKSLYQYITTGFLKNNIRSRYIWKYILYIFNILL